MKVRNLVPPTLNGTPHAAAAVEEPTNPADVTPPTATGLAVFSGAGFVPALPTAEQMGDVGQQYGAYVGSAHPKSGQWAQLQAAGVQEGDFYLSLDGDIKRVMPLPYWLISAELFKTKMDDLGNITAATRDMSVETPQGMQPKWDEHYVCLIVVDTPTGLYPAKADFRGVKSGAATNAVKNNIFAYDPKFSGVSAEHKIAAQFPQPWGRMYHTATTSKRVAKGNGRLYHAANCTSRPVTLAQMEKFGNALNDAEFLRLVEQAKQSYLDRVAAIVAKLPK